MFEGTRPLSSCGHVGEMGCWIGATVMFLWRAFNDEGEAVGLGVRRRRDTVMA